MVILWKLSDVILLLLTIGVIQNLLFIVLFISRRFCEKRLSMGRVGTLMRILVFYILFFLPVITAFVMYKATYSSIESAVGERIGLNPHIRMESFSTRTAYGNHWAFVVLFGLWMAGICVRGLMPYLKECHLLKRIKMSRTDIINPTLIKTVKDLKKELGIKKNIQILESALVGEPFVIGIFHSCMFFPKLTLEKSIQELLVRHELIHCRYNDVFYRRLLFLLGGLYWFNPFLNAFAYYFVEVSEIACDEKVLEGCSLQARKRYAELLAAIGQGEGLPRQSAALTGHAKSSLEKRLEYMLKKEKKINKWSFSLQLILLAGICPFITVSAASGMSAIQDIMIKRVLSDTEEVIPQEGSAWTEIVDYVIPNETEASIMHLEARDILAVDVVLNGEEMTFVGTTTLEKGNKLSFAIWGERSVDEFQAGYIDSSGKRTSVSAVDGEIDYAFTVAKTDTYTLFIAKTNMEQVHVKGGVTNNAAEPKPGTEQIVLGQECKYGDDVFVIEKVELLNSKFVRVYFSGLNGTEFMENIFLLKTKDNPKCGPSDNHCDTESTGILTYTFEDGITLEEVLALRVRPLGTKAVDESYTEFPLTL